MSLRLTKKLGSVFPQRPFKLILTRISEGQEGACPWEATESHVSNLNLSSEECGYTLELSVKSRLDMNAPLVLTVQ
jgi:hypothetical protein